MFLWKKYLNKHEREFDCGSKYIVVPHYFLSFFLWPAEDFDLLLVCSVW